MEDGSQGLWSTRTLMTTSAAFMAAVGLTAAFFPDEVLGYFGYPARGFGVVLVKVVGGLYFGLGILNWMGRHKAIGGIYSRPVAMTNFVHFLVVALVFVRHLPDTDHIGTYAAAGGANAAFAAAFGWLLFCGRDDAADPSCS